MEQAAPKGCCTSELRAAQSPPHTARPASRDGKAASCEGIFGGSFNLAGVHLLGFAVSKLAVKNGPF